MDGTMEDTEHVAIPEGAPKDTMEDTEQATIQEDAPNESGDADAVGIDEDSALTSSGHHSYSAITAYLQSGTYPSDADRKQKNSLRKRVKFFVLLAGKLHYIGGHGKKTLNLQSPDW